MFESVLLPIVGLSLTREEVLRPIVGRAAKDGVPFLEDQVVVEVVGQPGVTKQQLYFLALSAANGIVRKFGNLSSFVPPYGRIMIEYDAADHWVRATVEYRWSMYANVAANFGGPGVATIEDLTAHMAVYRGPQCDVVGGKFDFETPEAGAGAVFRLPTAVPKLPFTGQPILTACARTKTPVPRPIDVDPATSVPVLNAGLEIDSPNPKPPGDNRSRGAVVSAPVGLIAAAVAIATGAPASPGTPVPGPAPTAPNAKCCDKVRFLIPLVYAALSGAATDAQMTYPAPTAGPTGG